MGIFSREMENIKKKKMNMLEMQNTMLDMRNAFPELMGRLNTAKETIR